MGRFVGNSVFKRLFFMSVTVGSSLASQIGITVVLAHVFGVEGIGEYGYHYAIASFFGLVSVFGFPVYLQRELSARPSEFERIHSDALSFKILLDGVLLLLALLVLVVFEIPNPALFCLLYVARILMAYNTFFLVEFRVVSAFKVESMLSVAGNLLYFVLALSIAFTTGSLIGVAFGLLVAQLIVLICVIICWRAKSGRRILTFTTEHLRQTFKRNFPYALDQGLTEFLGHITSFLIGLFLGTSALGIYQAGLRLANGVLTLASIVGGTFISKLSGYWSSNQSLFWRESNYAALILHGIGIGAFFGFLFGGEYLTVLLYTSEFELLNTLWPLFGLYVAAKYLTGVPGILLIAVGQQKRRVWINIGTCLTTVLFFYFAVDQLGLAGVLLLLLVSQILTIFIYTFIAGKINARSWLNLLDTPVHLLFLILCVWVIVPYV